MHIKDSLVRRGSRSNTPKGWEVLEQNVSRKKTWDKIRPIMGNTIVMLKTSWIEMKTQTELLCHATIQLHLDIRPVKLNACVQKYTNPTKKKTQGNQRNLILKVGCIKHLASKDRQERPRRTLYFCSGSVVANFPQVNRSILGLGTGIDLKRIQELIWGILKCWWWRVQMNVGIKKWFKE